MKFYPVFDAISRRTDLGAPAKLVHGWISGHCSRGAPTEAPYSQLQRCLGLTLRQVRRAMDELITLGLVDVLRRQGPGRGRLVMVSGLVIDGFRLVDDGSGPRLQKQLRFKDKVKAGERERIGQVLRNRLPEVMAVIQAQGE